MRAALNRQVCEANVVIWECVRLRLIRIACHRTRLTRRCVQVVSTASTAPEEVEAAAARLQAEREEYVAMKQGLFRWSLSTTAMCFAAAYTFYSRVLIIYIYIYY